MATRDEYIDKLEKQLREWNSQVDKLQKQARQGSEEIRKRVNKRVEAINEKRSDLENKLGKLRESSGEAFDNIRDDAEVLWKDVKKGISDVQSALKE